MKGSLDLLQELIDIINPREKLTYDRIRALNARMKEYSADDIKWAAKAFSKSQWHKDNGEVSVDNLIRPSKFGRWFNEGQKLATKNPEPEATAEEDIELEEFRKS